MKNAFSDTNRTDNPRNETTRLRALAIGFRLIMTAAPKPIMTRAKIQKRKEGITDYGFPILDWRLNSSRARRKTDPGFVSDHLRSPIISFRSTSTPLRA